MTPAILVSALWIAACFASLAIITVYRARKYGTAAPELQHVLPIGGACVLVAAGVLVALFAAPDVGAVLSAVGMTGVTVTRILVPPRAAAQPTPADLAPLTTAVDALADIKPQLNVILQEVQAGNRRLEALDALAGKAGPK